MTDRELSLDDALSLPHLVAEVGIPILGLSVLESLAAEAAPGSPLAPAIHAQERAFRDAESRGAEHIAGVEAALARLGCTPPPRPVGAVAYLQWNDAVLRAVASVTAPERPAGAIAAVARTFGDFMQALALLIVVTELRVAAPGSQRLAAQERSLLGRADACAQRLQNVAALGSLPDAARAVAQRIATTTGLVQKLDAVDPATRAAGLKMIAERLAREAAALRAAAGG